MISCEMTELSSDILRYYIVMLSERGDWKPPGRWTGHRCRSSRSDDDVRQLRVTRNRTPYRRDACRRRVGEPLRQPRKDGAGDRFRCTLARGTGGDLLRWSRNAAICRSPVRSCIVSANTCS